jgi:uncharacterized membrane protein YeaQ/YmgE (transglycosylase-associated protein family)
MRQVSQNDHDAASGGVAADGSDPIRDNAHRPRVQLDLDTGFRRCRPKPTTESVMPAAVLPSNRQRRRRVDPRRDTYMVGTIIGIIVIGLIAGAIARLLIPGTGGMSIPLTMVIGIVGSFVGGFLGYLLFHKDSQDGFVQPSGWIGSIIGAVIVLLLWMRFAGGRKSLRA